MIDDPIAGAGKAFTVGHDVGVGWGFSSKICNFKFSVTIHRPDAFVRE
jgi:hypothetical protein